MTSEKSAIKNSGSYTPARSKPKSEDYVLTRSITNSSRRVKLVMAPVISWFMYSSSESVSVHCLKILKEN
jgi:hypothetical protein